MPSLSPEQSALLTLKLVSGLGSRLITALLERFGSAQAVLTTSALELARVPRISPKLAAEFRKALDEINVAEEVQRMTEKDVYPIFLGDENYPPQLAQIPNPPRILYVRGALLSEDERAIAIVGSRHCSPYGREVARKLARDLAGAGWTIISGLARGIDAAGHQGALETGRTIAILAGGLSSIYPPEHKDLANKVAAAGALITEAHMQMEPLSLLFPERNRIITGLAQALVVVEAGQKSGALLTAKHALEQGRDIFAVPGPVNSEFSAGPLELLRKGAKLIRNADDLLEDIQGTVFSSIHPPGEISKTEFRPTKPPENLSEDQNKIWHLLEEVRPVDVLSQELELAIPDLNRLLLDLEMKRIVRRLPGNRFERV